MVWISFAASLFIGIGLLLLPGYLLGRLFLADRSVSLCISPLVSTTLYNGLAFLYALIDISCNLTSLVMIPAALLVFCIFILNRKKKTSSPNIHITKIYCARPLKTIKLSWISLSILFSVLTAAFVTIVFYISSIGTPDTYLSNYDNAFHLTHLRCFIDSGNYSSFSGGFYPSAWHCLAALISSATGCSLPVATHAATLSCVLAAYPLGMCFLLCTLFPNSPRRTLLGSLFCCCTWFFPWKLILFGPLYPNLTSFSLMPAALALFIRLFGENEKSDSRLCELVLFLLSGIALVFAQPNTVFFSFIVAIPYLMFRIRTIVANRYLKNSKMINSRFCGIVAEFLLLLLFLSIWIILMRSPLLEPLVSYERDVPYTFTSAIPKLLTFQFVMWRPQYLLCGILIFGLICLYFRSSCRWFFFSYVLVGFVYLVSAGVDGPLRSLVSGFCYNDYYRTAACVCIISIPIIAVGLDTLLGLIFKVTKIINKCGKSTSSNFSSVILIATISAFNYFPLFDIPRVSSWGFDSISYYVADEFTSKGNRYYSDDEMSFVNKAKQICNSDLVVNQPYDGSVFSYSLNDLNVLFPQLAFDQEGDKEILKKGLSRISTDSNVASAAHRLSAKYVIQLDQGSGPTGMSLQATYYPFSYDSSEWVGINEITDETPGFKLLLSEGDKRLYEILS